MSADRATTLRFRIRGLLIGFMIGLLISGITAFPLVQEVGWLLDWIGGDQDAAPNQVAGMLQWLTTVRGGLEATQANYPFLFYGTDWLAFGHIVIALVFLGPLKDPVRNIWVVEWGMIACVLVIPLALICGAPRGIPFGWQLIDCSFGVVGMIPLALCRRWIKELERSASPQPT